MAHHQHHGADYEAQVSRSLSTRPTSPHNTSMPSISEDELLAEPDEPPEPHFNPAAFTKHSFVNPLGRRPSLLTRAIHNEPDSFLTEEEQQQNFPPGYFNKLSSVSSTCSNPSVRSNGDFTSDDGRVSPSTRPSTPGSPRSVLSIPKIALPLREPPHSSLTDSLHDSDEAAKPVLPEQQEEAAVEAKLGRKRCIMFACGGTASTATLKAPEPEQQPKGEPAAAPKRACTIKFACPFKAARAKVEEPSRIATRHLSPAPGSKITTAFAKRHRDSDTTIKMESPTTPKAPTPSSPRRNRRLSQHSDITRAEACRFHEFASEDDEVDDWTQESTCHKTPLTVNDTLKKENDIRRLAEEADEEEALDEELGVHDEDDDDNEDLSSDDDDEFSDAGFHSDDEEGFAESDDEEDSDSDYEWWAPRKTRAASPYVGHDVFRPLARTLSNSSVESDDNQLSPKAIKMQRGRHGQKRTRPVPIRPGTPELPDSTDFVCGTLDEDRPMEEAYMSCLEQRKAAKHRVCPQDIDPSFPLSDPEIGSDDDDAQVDAADAAEESDHFMHGHPDDVVEDGETQPRGRRLNPLASKRSPMSSPKRLRSPPPPKKSCAQHRSPAPVSIFNHSSPRRLRSPAPPTRLISPPPSRRTSVVAGGPGSLYIPFLGMRGHQLTHTASLPRSPGPIHRRKPSSSTITRVEDEDDEGDASDRTVGRARYTRGAIDIAQGLETKRLKRREKFYQRYARKEERKERKGLGRTRPCPGKGAQRMKQVGLECAVYRGKRICSI